ncbi:interleukin-2 receptor subunit beta isoform X2 [Myripristis murdjan]|uniref:interleukin-2 receptor subunit beta isoform X2 n=1 Tax=Myripristis murdjan TaxID=586833 RepID=UPI001175F56C|nr:interleukin-2 receptor subunit beta-like isoform X2 [Myripristis murdjan]
MGVVAMEILWSLCLVVVLVSVHPAKARRGLQVQGLSCVNDFVNNVSCTWNSSHIEPGIDCWIFGEKKSWVMGDTGAFQQLPMIRSCKLKQLGSSVQGCSFVFENKAFSCSEVMSSIRVECNGTAVDSLTKYEPCYHRAANVSINDSWISWTPGSPRSNLFILFEFELEIKQNHQKWKEATTLPTDRQGERIPDWARKAGHYEARVRVKPSEMYPNSHWSDWSPVASWVIVGDMTPALEDKVPPLDQTRFNQATYLVIVISLSLSFSLIVILIVCLRSCMRKGLFKRKPVPNPSKYFHTLHSVHGGNIKKWLNPQTASESFFIAQPCDQISPVEVFDVWDVVRSTTPSSTTTALLHCHSGCASSGLGSSGVVEHSSSSSSSPCFSNMGYFYPSYPSTSLRIDPSPDYFTYRDDFLDSHNLQLSLCPFLAGSSTYEGLHCPKREHNMEPHSPDSGFGVGKEDQADFEEDVDVGQEEVSGDHHDSPLLIFPLQLPSWMCPPSSPPPACPPSSCPPPCHPPSLPQVHPDQDVPVVAPSGSYVSLPVGGAMCRSSSMPVEAGKTGYLTLKDLQTTYSNKSI